MNTPFLQALRDALGSAGWLRFDHYMAIALGHPQGGYYSRVGAPMGESGDFITAPEMGPWLAGCLAEAFRRLQAEAPGQPLEILELGAGTGRLALDVLQALGAAPACLPVHYWILETSPSLMADQRETLSAGLDGADPLVNVSWLTQLPRDFQGLIVANEVADALPVRLFEWEPDGVLEWGLEADDEGLPRIWASRPADAKLAQAVEHRRQQLMAKGLSWLPGHRGEFCPALVGWGRALGEALAWGEVLLIDYGYERWELDHPDRHGGTLAGHFRHRRLDDWNSLVAHPGQVDLTAHVDFTDLAGALRQAGLDDQTLQTQAAWMLDHGVLELAQQRLFSHHEAGAPPADPAVLRQLGMLQRLLSDSEMGQAFLLLSSRRRSRASRTA